MPQEINANLTAEQKKDILVNKISIAENQIATNENAYNIRKIQMSSQLAKLKSDLEALS